MENKQIQEKSAERIVRIMSKDIEGKTKIYSGLTKIKGVSWTLSNAACVLLGIDKSKKIGELSDGEISKISSFLKKPSVPAFILNRRKNSETGEDEHLTGVELELRNEFDIKRLKKIRSYRGLRHTLNLPSRGQRTKGNFRKHRRKGSGIKKKVKQNEKKA